MSKKNMIQALNSALDIMLKENDDVYVLGEDVRAIGGGFGVAWDLYKKHGGEKVLDTPLSEAAIIGTAVGSAVMGMRPVAEIMFGDFFGTCYDQIVNNAAKIRYIYDGQFKVPLVIRASVGAGVAGAAHHSQQVEGWFLNVPGLTIVAPTTPYDAKGLLIASIENDNPILFLEHKAIYGKKGEVPDKKYSIPLRKANVVQEGSDVTVVANMWMMHKTLAAAKDLETEGVSVEIIDLRTLRPWDHETVLNSVKKTGRAVVVDEASAMGSLGSDISVVIFEELFSSLKAPVQRVNGLDTPIPFALNLEQLVIPGEEDIKSAVRSVMSA